MTKPPHVLDLVEPIELVSAKDGSVVSRIEKVTVHPPRLGDLVKALDAGMDAQGTMLLNLASSMCRLPKQDIERMSLEDGARLLGVVQGFMPAGLMTGKNGSGLSLLNSASPPIGDAGGQPSSPSGVHVQLSCAE